MKGEWIPPEHSIYQALPTCQTHKGQTIHCWILFLFTVSFNPSSFYFNLYLCFLHFKSITELIRNNRRWLKCSRAVPVVLGFTNCLQNLYDCLGQHKYWKHTKHPVWKFEYDDKDRLQLFVLLWLLRPFCFQWQN